MVTVDHSWLIAALSSANRQADSLLVGLYWQRGMKGAVCLRRHQRQWLQRTRQPVLRVNITVGPHRSVSSSYIYLLNMECKLWCLLASVMCLLVCRIATCCI